jgi:TfoX/Sxy family transcriptional regulator of competence genes
MQMPKPTDADKEFFRSIAPNDPAVEVKPMFGNLGAFANGNMFAGLFGSTVGVKLDEAARAELELIDGVGPFGPPERPMGGYVGLPAAWRDDPEQASAWVARAFSYVASLPPKAAKPKRSR